MFKRATLINTSTALSCPSKIYYLMRTFSPRCRTWTRNSLTCKIEFYVASPPIKNMWSINSLNMLLLCQHQNKVMIGVISYLILARKCSQLRMLSSTKHSSHPKNKPIIWRNYFLFWKFHNPIKIPSSLDTFKKLSTTFAREGKYPLHDPLLRTFNCFKLT